MDSRKKDQMTKDELIDKLNEIVINNELGNPIIKLYGNFSLEDIKNVIYDSSTDQLLITDDSYEEEEVDDVDEES